MIPPSVRRTRTSLGRGWYICIVHDCDLMLGPPGFLNIGAGSYTAPWGIWTLVKENEFGFRVPISSTEALDAVLRAKAFTSQYTAENMRRADQLGYVSSLSKRKRE